MKKRIKLRSCTNDRKGPSLAIIGLLLVGAVLLSQVANPHLSELFAPNLRELLAPRTASAQSSTSFYPTWKLLKPSERKLYLSGYLHGWRDSRKVTEILKSHVENNPDSAVSSLEKIRELYSTADVPIEELVERLTQFYSDPENHDAPLSVAVSASK